MSQTFAESWKGAPRGLRIAMSGFFIALFGALLGFGLLELEFNRAAVAGYVIVVVGVLTGGVGVALGFVDIFTKAWKYLLKL